MTDTNNEYQVIDISDFPMLVCAYLDRTIAVPTSVSECRLATDDEIVLSFNAVLKHFLDSITDDEMFARVYDALFNMIVAREDHLLLSCVQNYGEIRYSAALTEACIIKH